MVTEFPPGVHGLQPRRSGNRRLSEEVTVAKEDRGFASMDRGKQKDIASKGGKAAHVKGTAHEWTSEEARAAGRKGGMASHRRKQALAAASTGSDQSAFEPAGTEDNDHRIESRVVA